MERSKWVWMAHPGHFCAAERCGFRLNTYVGGYIVSTVGEMTGLREPGSGKFEEIGWERTYETMVFRAVKAPKGKEGEACCPWRANVSGGELDMEGYQDADTARKGHLRLCEKWSKKRARTSRVPTDG